MILIYYRWQILLSHCDYMSLMSIIMNKEILKISDNSVITSNCILSFFCAFASSHPSFERWLFSNYLLLTFVNGVKIKDRIESQLNFFAPDISACELLECIKVKHDDENPDTEHKQKPYKCKDPKSKRQGSVSLPQVSYCGIIKVETDRF